MIDCRVLMNSKMTTDAKRILEENHILLNRIEQRYLSNFYQDINYYYYIIHIYHLVC